MPPSPQEATWTQTHSQPGAGGSGFWNSAPWILLLALSPNTSTCEDTHEGAETPAKEEEEGGVLSCLSENLCWRESPDGLCWGCGAQPSGRRGSQTRGSTLPLQPPGTQCQRPGRLSMTTQPPSPGRTQQALAQRCPSPQTRRGSLLPMVTLHLATRPSGSSLETRDLCP